MSKQLSVILKSKEVRGLIENFFSLSILKLVNAILPFVTLPYLIKVLGFDKYGAIILAISLMAYFQSITDYGFNLSATREVSKHRYSNKQLNYIYSKTIISKLYLLIISLILILVIILNFSYFYEDKIIYMLMSLVLCGQVFFPEWFFRGIEKMKYITIIDFIIKSIFTVGIFLLVKESNDYWIYPLLFGCSYIIVGIFSNIFVINKFKIRLIWVKPKFIMKNLIKSFPLFLNQFFPNLFNNTTNFLIGMILGKSYAGMFGATRQITQILSVFNSVVSTVFFPFLVKNKNKFHIFMKLYLIVFIILFFTIWIFHSFLFNLIGVKYDHLEGVFLFLLMGVFSIVIYNIFATNYLLVRGKDKIVARITIFSSLTGFIFSYPLIKTFGLLGGAFNIFLCQLILGFGAYICYRKHKTGVINES